MNTELESIGDLIVRRDLPTALERLRALIHADPLNSRAFSLFAEVKASRGEIEEGEVAAFRSRQLDSLQGLQRDGHALERYLAIMDAASDPECAFCVEGHTFSRLRTHEEGGLRTAVGCSLDGDAFIKICSDTDEEARARFDHDVTILQHLTEHHCSSSPAVLATGLLESRPFVLMKYARADRGGFGMADVLLALLEQRALGVYIEAPSLRHVRFDSMTGVCRLTGFHEAIRLDDSVRRLPVVDFWDWCLEREEARNGNFLAGLAYESGRVLEGGRLSLIRSQLFSRQRIAGIGQSGLQSVELTEAYLPASSPNLEALEAIDFKPRERVLEIGCGTGAVTRYLAGRGCQVTGVGSHPEQILGARALNNLAQMESRFHQLDLDFDVLGGPFDTVLLLGTLRDFWYPEQVVERLLSLRPKRLIASAEHSGNGYKWLGRWFRRPPSSSRVEEIGFSAWLSQLFHGCPVRALSSDGGLKERIFVIEPEYASGGEALNALSASIVKPSDKTPSRSELIRRIRTLVDEGNATEAMARYAELAHAQDSRLLPPREFANLLKKAACHEAAECVFWKAVRKDPRNLKLLQECLENLLDLADAAWPEKLGEARELAAYLFERFPDNPDALFAMAQVWYKSSRMDRCLPLFREFFRRVPDHAARAGFVFNLNYDEEIGPEALAAEHKAWANRYIRLVKRTLAAPSNDANPERRLRVGYVSPDLGMHPVGYFAIPVLEAHDSSQVEVFIYSHRDRLAEHDGWSRRLSAAVGEEHWRWIEKDSIAALLERIRRDRIDVLVDLAGHSRRNRLDAFANRAAPVQVSWLGYPHSTWLPGMDYRLSDAIVEPEGDADIFSSEIIYRLPRGFHALKPDPSVPAPASPPILENGYITFGSFNNINKIGPRTIHLWSSLLRSIPGSRLLLKHKSMQVLENREGLRSLFALEGVHPRRISFKGVTQDHLCHMEAYRQMDIALDPVAYNGTTTTCEALYMGVPVLTLPGRTHASRVSASLLHRVGLEGWVARDERHYRRIAQFAAANPGILATRRARLREDFLASPLADVQSLARDLESAYRTFWERYCGCQSCHLKTTLNGQSI